MKEAASNWRPQYANATYYLPRAKPSFCVTSAITEKPRAIAIVTVQKVSPLVSSFGWLSRETRLWGFGSIGELWL